MPPVYSVDGFSAFRLFGFSAIRPNGPPVHPGTRSSWVGRTWTLYS